MAEIKKYLSLKGLDEYNSQVKAKYEAGDTSTLESAKYYTDTEITKLQGGSVTVKNAEHADSADEATKATQDASGNVITTTYETKADASTKLTEAKSYTDTEVAKRALLDHNHDTDYDDKGSADTAESNANSYTDSKVSAAKTDLTTTINNTKTTLQGNIDSVSEILSAVKEDVDAFFADADMTANAKDTLKELQEYIASDTTGAASMTASIKQNSDDIDVLEGRIDAAESDIDTLQTEMDAVESKSTTNASNLSSHTSNKSNPHGVTLSQLGVNASATEINILKGATVTTAELNVLDGITATTAELNYVDGVTSNIQTQLNAKADQISLDSHVNNKSNPHGITIAQLGVNATATELNYVDGVTSGIQAQLDGKAASSHGTHVTYSTTAPVMDGTAAVGTAATVARSDHKHPTDTSRASKTEFDSHNSDTTKHITSTERTTWNAKAAQTSLDSHTGNKSNPHGVTLGQLNVTSTAAELNVLDGITATTAELNYVDGVTSNIQTQLDGKSASGHTHNYAGSSSVGGAATSASKLNTNAGSATQPVYFANGIPVATTYTLGKSVPSDAKFTDTTYSNATTSANGLMSSTDKTKLDGVETGAQANPTPVTTAGDGAAFTATVSFIDSLVVGSSFVMVPNTTSTTTTPTLNVNGLGAKPIRRRLSSLPTSVQGGYSTNWLTQNKPYTIVYDGTNWIVEGMTKPAAADLYGSMKSLYTATLSTTWTAASTGFTQTVSVSGIKSTDTPVVGIVQTGTVDTDKAMIEGWSLVSRITTADGSITAYCYGDAPTVALPIQLLCIR